MKKIYGGEKVESAIENMAEQIKNRGFDKSKIGILGIRNKGVIVARRLADSLNKKLGGDVEFGSIDITFYRDDITIRGPEAVPVVGVTEINFDINHKIIILADDVLHTGRSCRAAMDAVVEFGRPAKIMLAVLLDRGGREFPIQADFVGDYFDNLAEDELLTVKFREVEGKDGIFIDSK
ncbi:bifunctional pyr operon transcriptional regulator/uracil phosphoribosyltransferase PyrR [Sedimentisphaera salicampi]|uniref:bifunctional pyr operon transcriptional regulator/uracil phosphoribosyltransferase PyrR n=1 Tax=Sedimentisphaera salicampi TaxID=1941349 RepID=UPI000B9ABB8A|nr:bifunctional pyr operon transcriptional regulator/uracil phosphoribosyltransferase PyrR [Sedimentisphaera salicampi]OXU14136.1 Bifunctional protein PyrR [Sedimentisphaera salicampi]